MRAACHIPSTMAFSVLVSQRSYARFPSFHRRTAVHAAGSLRCTVRHEAMLPAPSILRTSRFQVNRSWITFHYNPRPPSRQAPTPATSSSVHLLRPAGSSRCNMNSVFLPTAICSRPHAATVDGWLWKQAGRPPVVRGLGGPFRGPCSRPEGVNKKTVRSALSFRFMRSNACHQPASHGVCKNIAASLRILRGARLSRDADVYIWN